MYLWLLAVSHTEYLLRQYFLLRKEMHALLTLWYPWAFNITNLLVLLKTNNLNLVINKKNQILIHLWVEVLMCILVLFWIKTEIKNAGTLFCCCFFRFLSFYLYQNFFSLMGITMIKNNIIISFVREEPQNIKNNC